MIDSHIDTIQRVMVMGEDLGKRWDVGHVDIPRLHEGGMHAPFFAFWVPVYFPGAEAVRRTLDLRDAMRSVLDAHAGPDRARNDGGRYRADCEGKEDRGLSDD